MSNLKGRVRKLEQENVMKDEGHPGSRIVIFHTFPDGQVFDPGRERFYPNESTFWRNSGKSMTGSVPFPWRVSVTPEEFLAERAASKAATVEEYANWQPSEYALSLMQKEGISGPLAMHLEKLMGHNL